MSAQVAADLRAAADVLERDGWTQGTFTDKRTGCHCVAGALAEIHPTAAISHRRRGLTGPHERIEQLTR